MSKTHPKYVQEAKDEMYFVHDTYYKASGAILMGDEEAYTGLAACSPKDQWCRKIGRTIAAGRAKKAAMLAWPQAAVTIPLDIRAASKKARIEWAIRQLSNMIYNHIGRNR